MKVVKLLTDDETKKRLEGEKHSRFLSVDPLAAKYPELTPYCFVANNPIRYMDPDGRDIVDPNGKHVRIIYNKNGTLSFSKNATTDIIRIANALNLTEAGRAQLKKIDQSDIKVKLNISTSTKIIKEKDKVSYEYGRTEQGNSNNPPSYSKYINQEGVYGIKEATIMIFEGTIKEGIKESSGLKHEGLNMEQAIGAVAGHEIIHATDKTEINKDIKVEFGSKKEKKVREASREIKPNQIERKIIDQSKKLNE